MKTLFRQVDLLRQAIQETENYIVPIHTVIGITTDIESNILRVLIANNLEAFWWFCRRRF